MDFSVTISPKTLQLIAQIDEFKGRWEALGAISRDHLTQLKKTATIESIASSTRIEGATLSDQEVESLLTNLEVQEFQTRDEQEVASYAQAMDLIFESWEHLRISENHIQQLHSTLLKFSSKDTRHRGRYKTLDNHVVAFDADGNQVGIIFATTSPFDTPAHMRELLQWYHSEEATHSTHPLIRTAQFIVRFLAIHPFQDGNGRLSRILTTLLLLQSGYSYVPYASIERIVEDNKEHYYRALRTTQTTFHEPPIDWEPWLQFFLQTLWKQCAVLRSKVEDHRIIQSQNLTPLSIKILTLFESHPRLSNREIVALTDSNSNTVKATLSRLVKEKLLRTEGKGRATTYRLLK